MAYIDYCSKDHREAAGSSLCNSTELELAMLVLRMLRAQELTEQVEPCGVMVLCWYRAQVRTDASGQLQQCCSCSTSPRVVVTDAPCWCCGG